MIATIGRILFVVLLTLLGVGSVVAVILSAVVYYRSTPGAAYRDIESLEKPLAELKGIWSDNGELSALQGVLDKKNVELQDAAQNIASKEQVVSSQLQTVSANLSYLREVLRNARSNAAGAVGDLDAKVTALKAKLGPPDAPEKVAEALIRETGSIFIAILWPLVFFVMFFYLLHSRHAPERLRALLGGFKSLKLGLAEIVLSESEKTKARTEGEFEAWRDHAKLQYDLWVQRKSIRQKLEEVVDEVAKHFRAGGKELPEYRCTLHVPDIVFADTLYQLLDYLPTGAGRGRVFSLRFGMIGKVWRLLQPEVQGKVEVDERTLIEKWGMTKEEAKRAARDRQSFLCVPLKDNKEGYVGVFYMDSRPENVFDIQGRNPDDLFQFITQQCQTTGLIEALAKVKEDLGGRAPLIRVYEK